MGVTKPAEQRKATLQSCMAPMQELQEGRKS